MQTYMCGGLVFKPIKGMSQSGEDIVPHINFTLTSILWDYKS